MKKLCLHKLTQKRFAEFGDVIDTTSRESFPINKGSTLRFHDITTIDIQGDDGHANISIGESQPFFFPLSISMLERHPLGSQAWIPLNNTPFVIIVAKSGEDDKPDESTLQAFYADGCQGVNYARGIWHHPLLNLQQAGKYLIVDRAGSAPNCDEYDLLNIYEITDDC